MLVRFKKSERQKLVHDTCLREGFRMTARCALYYKMCHFLAQRLSWQGRHFRSPVASLSGALSFKYCGAKFSGKRFCGASSASSLYAPGNVWPFHHHLGGASKLPPNPPWSMGDFALPLNPHRPKSFQCPLETLTNRAPIGCRE